MFSCTKSESGNTMGHNHKLDATQTIIEYSLDNNAIGTIKRVVDLIDERCYIEFFDFYYPQISDPGAYVTIRKENGLLEQQLGNHGWSSEWKPIAKDSLVENIYKNRNYNNKTLKLTARSKRLKDVQVSDFTVIRAGFYNIDDLKE